MFPVTPLPQTQLATGDVLHPLRSASAVIDVLSEFVPGQKLLAQVQAQLANGAYRATIAQRDITLALPFSAKAGDALELEVVETDGRIAFAVSRPRSETEDVTASATTTLSRTGQLIARLMSGPDLELERPVVLNEGRVLLEQPTTPARHTASNLQQALGRSGLFYESHLASWVAGRLSEAVLRAEPQGQFSRLPSGTPQSATVNGAATHPASPTSSPVLRDALPVGALLEETGGDRLPAASSATSPAQMADGQRNSLGQPIETSSSSPNSEASKSGVLQRSGLPGELAPLVQQQLSGLASNVYAFHGMAWAGQPFHWEIIDENSQNARDEGGDAPRQWKTRLKMILPVLGDIDATIQLDGNDVSIRMTSGEDHTLGTLKSGQALLQQRMELAGLRLSTLELRPVTAPDLAPGDDELSQR